MGFPIIWPLSPQVNMWMVSGLWVYKQSESQAHSSSIHLNPVKRDDATMVLL